MKLITPTLAICLLAVLAAVVAAATDLGATGPASSDYRGGAVVTIEDFTYNAVVATPGAEVAVHNVDRAPHTVTADEADAFDSGQVDPSADGTFVAPAQPGTYDYHCAIHPTMHGTLVVTGGSD